MSSTAQSQDSTMQLEVSEFSRELHQHGTHAALKYLNNRTPHRYTGIFRFDGTMLRNEALFDRYNPSQEKGADAPMEATYCSLVGRQQQPLEINDASTDVRVKGIIDTPVVSYCGVLIRDGQGQPFGTLCHYDMQRCQERSTDLPLLEAAAQLFYAQLRPAAS